MPGSWFDVGEMAFFIVGHPPTPNVMTRWGWQQRARERRTWRDAAAWSARAALSNSTLRGEMVPMAIHVEFEYLIKRTRDRDNLIASLKPVIDGLVDARILKDDNPTELVRLTVSEKVGKDRTGIYVRVTEL